MMRTTIAAATLLVLAGLGLAACGDGEAGGDVSISMTEFAFDPDEVVLPAGEEVTLTLTNDGSIRHEFMVGREVMGDGATQGYMEDFFHGIEPTVTPPEAAQLDAHADHAGFMVMLQPGETADVSFTVPADRAGEWEMGCFESGHYEAGMHGNLIVKES